MKDTSPAALALGLLCFAVGGIGLIVQSCKREPPVLIPKVPKPPLQTEIPTTAESVGAKNEEDTTKIQKTVRINTATQTELESLPGVGPSIAARIIATRNKIGRFHRLRGLRRVPGIGYKTFKRLRPHLSLE